MKASYLWAMAAACIAISLAPSNRSFAECGDDEAYLGSFDGVPAYSNGVNTGTGYGDCQCVEYIRRFHDLGQTGNGNQVYGNRANANFTQFPNGSSTSPPQPGDIICFDDGGYGHVGIVTEVGNGYVLMIDQNRSSSNPWRKLNMSESSGNYTVGGFGIYGVQGWLRNPGYMPPNCHEETVQIYDDNPVYGMLMVTDPDGANFDFHEYYEAGGGLTLLNRGDMGSGFANPVIDDEGSVDNKEKWLAGDVDANGYDDIVLITHLPGDEFKAHVWLANGDGTFQARERWLWENGQADYYFLGDKNGDGDRDLITATQVRNGVVRWDKCPSNRTGFEACHTWVSDFGSDVDTDVFLVDDFSGNGKADILRGYEKSANDSCYTGGKKLKWRAYASGQAAEWLDNWGCRSSDYLSGNFNGDPHGRSDLAQVRFDNSTTGHVYVAKSNGFEFYHTSEWKPDFGSPGHRYFVWDVNQDGNDDLISYKDGGDDCINVSHSNGGSGFGTKHLLISGVDKEAGGAFRFGYFGDIHLAIGEEIVTICDPAAQAVPDGPYYNDYPAQGSGSCALVGSLELAPAWIGDEYYDEWGSITVYAEPEEWYWIGCQAEDCFTPYEGELESADCGNGWNYCYWWSAPDCEAGPYPSGMQEHGLVKPETSQSIYLLEGGSRRLIPDAGTYLGCGFSWSDYGTWPDADVYAVPEGADYTLGDCLPAGTLIKGDSSGSIYYLEGCLKRLIPSASAYLGCGFSWSDYVTYSQSAVDNTPAGPNYSCP